MKYISLHISRTWLVPSILYWASILYWE
jgi:hypothetical protein